MDLSEVAARETSALVQHVERDLAELTKRLAAAAAKERDAAVDRITTDRDAAVARLSAERDAAVARVTTECDAAVKRAAADRDAAVAKVTTEARAAADALRAEIAERVTENTTTMAALAEARADADALRAALESVETLLATARTELIESKRVLGETELARQAALAAQAEALAARDGETAARVTVETELQELREVIVEHERARVEIEARLDALAERDGVATALLDDLVSGCGTLATAATIPDILTTLVEQMAAEFPRVALFRPKANRLEGQHQIGFDLSNDITKVVMPLTLDSLLTRAATSGKLESASGGDMIERSHVPFGGTPLCAVAIPLVVQGETLGVVYADDFGGDRQDSAADRAARIKYCEVMQQHAVALLMRLTSELKTLAELRAYAGSLLKEIEEMYAADVGAGRTPDELRRRLQANVEYARSIFATRVSLECPEAAGLLEEELSAAIAREDGGGFARDLDATAGAVTQDRKRA